VNWSGSQSRTFVAGALYSLRARAWTSARQNDPKAAWAAPRNLHAEFFFCQQPPFPGDLDLPTLAEYISQNLKLRFKTMKFKRVHQKLQKFGRSGSEFLTLNSYSNFRFSWTGSYASKLTPRVSANLEESFNPVSD